MEPYRLTLDFSRKNKVDDKYAFKMQPQVYHRRQAGGAYSSAEFPWDEEFLAVIEQLRTQKSDPERLQRLGNDLRKFLEETGWANEETRLRQAVEEGRRVIITIRSAAAELYALPWEVVTLGQTMRHIGWLPNVLIAYEWVDDQPNKCAPETPSPRPEGGRILFAYSSAAGDVPHTRHLDAIQDACEKAHYAFDEVHDVVSGASLRSLRQSLEDASSGKTKPISILHVLCHGGPVGSTFGLMLDPDESGGSIGVDPAKLADLLAAHAGMVRLVVVAACDGGNIGPLGNHMGSVAQAIHRAGIAAVVASRYPLSKKGSNEFTEMFYRVLLGEPSSVESAFLAARRRLTEVDTGRIDWASMQLYTREIDGFDTRPVVIRPYQGLLPLGPAQNRFFFGRDKEVQEIVTDLGALVKAGNPRFLVVQGWSGTGKSSMVMAGAVPRLTKPADKAAGEPGTPNWSPGYASCKFKPGNDPMRNLFQALDHDKRRPLLLVVDQLEEIFTHTGEEERSKFVRELWRLARDPDSGISILVTIRSDFIGRCGELVLDDQGTRLDTIANNDIFSIRVSQLSKEQLRETIEKPAFKVGLQIPRALVNTILNDIGHSLGALPLVAHTMHLLWQGRQGRDLSLETYDKLGKVTGALYQHADKLIQDLDESGRKMAERLFLVLVGKNADQDGPVSGDTRRRIKLKEIRDEVCQRKPDREMTFDRLIESLDTGRLLVLEGEGDAKTVEVAHEALIHGWKTLDQWIEQHGDMIRRKKELDRWLHGHVSYGTLLNERQIETVASFEKDYSDVFTAEARALLDESRAKIASTQRRERIVLVASIAAAIVMGVLGIWASFERNKAVEQQNLANVARDTAQTATRMAVVRELLARGQPAPATRVLLDVQEPEKVPGWIELATETLSRQGPKLTLRHGGKVISAGWSPDGKFIATLSIGNDVLSELNIWNADGTGTPIPLRSDVPLRSPAWSPDSSRIAAVSTEGTVVIWRADGKGFPTLVKCAASLGDFVWSPNGEYIAATSGNNVVVSKTDGSCSTVVLEGHEKPIASISWSPDNKRIASAAINDKIVRVWNANGGEAPRKLEHEHEVATAEWSPDGRQIITTALFNVDSAILWTIDETRSPQKLDTNAESAAWSPDSNYIVTWSSIASDVRIFHREGQKNGYPIKLERHFDHPKWVAWSSDSAHIVTSSGEKSVEIWDSSITGKPIIVEGHEGHVNDVAWSPDGRHIVTASEDNTARIWDVQGTRVIRRAAASAFIASSATWSPDSKRIITMSGTGNTQVWRANGSPDAHFNFKGHTASGAAWSPDGKKLLLSPPVWDESEKPSIWSVENDKPAQRIVELERENKPGFLNASWSPDGRRIVAVFGDQAAIWSADGAKIVGFPAPAGQSIRSVSWSPDGQSIVTTSSDNTAMVWRADGTGKPFVVGHHDEMLRTASWSPDGKRILTTSSDKTARIWTVDTPDKPVLLSGHDEPPFAAWSPDGDYVVTTAGPNHTARIWRVDAPRTPIVLAGHRARINDVAWSPNGKFIATASNDKTIRIWNRDGQGTPMALEGHDDEVYAVAWSPDNSHIVSVSSDNTTRIWPVTIPALREALQDATTYCLTTEERQRFLLENEDEARTRYEACECSHKRRPFQSTAVCP